MSWDEFWQSVSALQLIGWVIGALAVIAFFAGLRKSHGRANHAPGVYGRHNRNPEIAG